MAAHWIRCHEPVARSQPWSFEWYTKTIAKWLLIWLNIVPTLRVTECASMLSPP